ncbi:NAD(P)-binding protein [Candidatus Alkanophaga liquidiphilum]
MHGGMPNTLDIRREYDIIVIGAGIGGLLAAALLCKHFKTLVLEKLSFLGGRFSSFNYKGYELPTGALHVIPHSKGVFARALKAIGIHGKTSEAWAEFLWEDRRHRVSNLLTAFKTFKSHEARESFIKVIASAFFGIHTEYTSFGEFLGKFRNEELYKCFKALIGFSMSAPLEKVSKSEGMRFIRNIVLLGKPLFPENGCKGVVERFKQVIIESGGEILTQVPVNGILVQSGEIRGVSASIGDEQMEIKCRCVVSNASPSETLRMMSEKDAVSELLRRAGSVEAAEGITICVSSSEKLFRSCEVVLTPSARRISGLIQYEQPLAPKGKYLLLTHQVFRGGDVRKEIELGVEDLKELLPHFEDNCEILGAHTFRDDWPVNWAIQGEDFDVRLPVRGLYMVGDGCKARGRIMTEGIAAGVLKVVRRVKKDLAG